MNNLRLAFLGTLLFLVFGAFALIAGFGKPAHAFAMPASETFSAIHSVVVSDHIFGITGITATKTITGLKQLGCKFYAVDVNLSGNFAVEVYERDNAPKVQSTGKSCQPGPGVERFFVTMSEVPDDKGYFFLLFRGSMIDPVELHYEETNIYCGVAPNRKYCLYGQVSPSFSKIGQIWNQDLPNPQLKMYQIRTKKVVAVPIPIWGWQETAV